MRICIRSCVFATCFLGLIFPGGLTPLVSNESIHFFLSDLELPLLDSDWFQKKKKKKYSWVAQLVSFRMQLYQLDDHEDEEEKLLYLIYIEILWWPT